jgi:acyl-CoA thioester hydrolase
MIPVSANRSTRIQVRFGDYDPNGHVNNVAYVAFMETARIAFLVSLREVGRMATTIIAHLRPITTRAKYVEVEMSVEKIGTSSFTLLHEIFDNHGLAARGRAVLVGIDPQGKSRSLTEHEQRTLAQHVQPEGQSVAVGQPA